MLEHISRMVRSFGCEVWEAATVDEALRIIRDQGPDAAVIDILMPDKDGLNFLMELPTERRPRIVAVTGGGRIGARQVLSMASGLGADAALTKPFSADELRTALGLTL